MTKGTSHQIVEITDTENPYFERAFLIVRQDCRDEPHDDIHRAGQKLLETQNGYSGIRRARRTEHLQKAFAFFCGALFGWMATCVWLFYK